MNEEIATLMEERKKCKDTPAYAALNKEIQAACKNAKEKWMTDKCKRIEDLQKDHRFKEMYDNIKEITNGKRKQKGGGCITDKNGNVLFERTKILDRWAEYIGELYNDDRGDKPVCESIEGPQIIESEIIQAIREMKNTR
jgi:hypothetical protein